VHYDWIVTDFPQSLLECYRVLIEKLPTILEKWEVTPDSLGVEYTAGTKPMSVAAVLATIDKTSQFFYVGAHDPSGRDRDGIGVVLDGKEWSWFQTNPWEELAVPARKEIALLFNHGRYTDAQERALRLAQVVPLEMRKVYHSLAAMIEGYALWDRFEYKQAQQKIYRALRDLQLYIAGKDDPLRLTLDLVENQVEFLRKLSENGPETARLDTLDMLANAARRAEAAYRYDDAVARLYSVLEGLARNRLKQQYQINSSDTPPEKIPDGMREEYVLLYRNKRKPERGLRLGLQASYHLLFNLGDELGQKYVSHEKELDQILEARNLSRLAHGTNPVKPETYTKLRDFLFDFAEISAVDLPTFPEMRL